MLALKHSFNLSIPRAHFSFIYRPKLDIQPRASWGNPGKSIHAKEFPKPEKPMPYPSPPLFSEGADNGNDSTGYWAKVKRYLDQFNATDPRKVHINSFY